MLGLFEIPFSLLMWCVYEYDEQASNCGELPRAQERDDAIERDQFVLHVGHDGDVLAWSWRFLPAHRHLLVLVVVPRGPAATRPSRDRFRFRRGLSHRVF